MVHFCASFMTSKELTVTHTNHKTTEVVLIRNRRPCIYILLIKLLDSWIMWSVT